MPRKRLNWIVLEVGSIVMIFWLQGCFFYFDTFSFEPYRSHATAAEELTEAGKYEDAIEEYKLHVSARLADENRPESENPYFYYLLIGDLYLKLDEVANAEKFYVIALEKDASTDIAKERLRSLGRWHEERGEFEKAFAVLKQYRELDPILFDFELDRLHKDAVRREMSEETAGESSK